MTGHVHCKLCSCASMCPTNAHSLLKAVSVKFPQNCTLTFFFCMYGNFSTFGGLRYICYVPGQFSLLRSRTAGQRPSRLAALFVIHVFHLPGSSCPLTQHHIEQKQGLANNPVGEGPCPPQCRDFLLKVCQTGIYKAEGPTGAKQASAKSTS